MSVVIITGSGGLVGSEACRFFAGKGFEVVGIDNDMRKQFFGPAASTRWQIQQLQETLSTRYTHYDIDIRDVAGIEKVFSRFRTACTLVLHCAAQPSHDWAAHSPAIDFAINGVGTINLLESYRHNCPQASFIFTSTNKVYGDRPNNLPLVEEDSRWELEDGHPFEEGIPETMSIDRSLHSVFGASKVAADIMVQEYGSYFGLQTVCFRAGCLTGPYHSGTELHGFLSYLLKCAVTDTAYTVFGYKGKQVRDNICSEDLLEAFFAFYTHPRRGEVYNIGGGRASNCSVLEGIDLCENIVGRKMKINYSEHNRVGDHIWWISGLQKFQDHYPAWRITRTVPQILQEIHDYNHERWQKV